MFVLFPGVVELIKNSLYITKTSCSNSSPKVWINDGALSKTDCNSQNQSTESVKFSLKKRNRWILPEHLSNQIKEFTNKKEKFVHCKDSSNQYQRILLLKKPTGFRPKHYDKYKRNQPIKSVQYSEEPEKDQTLSW